MTWAMVEAYGPDADTEDLVPAMDSRAPGLLAALHAESTPVWERLQRIHFEWAKLDLELCVMDFSSQPDRRL